RLRQFRQRQHAGKLHFLIDHRGADIHSAAEDEGEAQNVVDLVRVVGTTGGNDAVGAHFLCDLGPDLGLGIGQCQDQRLRCHAAQHVGGEYAGGGTAQEDVGIDAHVGKCAGVGTLGV